MEYLIDEGMTPQEIINNVMPFIDQALESRNTALSSRPYEAALLFVKHFVKSIEGYDLGNPLSYFDSPWFIAKVNHISEWYSKRYGDKFTNSRTDISAVQFINKHPFLLKFPISLWLDEGDEETTTIIFLCDLDENEDWKSYFDVSAILMGLDNSELSRVEAEVTATITNLRYIFHCCRMAKISEGEIKAMSEAISIHLSNAAQNIDNASGLNLNLALWDLQMAIEKSIKVLLHQEHGNFNRIHNLIELFEQSKYAKTSEVLEELKKFPDHRFVLAKRYGEEGFKNAGEMKEFYNAAVRAVRKLCELFEADITVHNARVYLKRSRYSGAEFT